MNKFIVYALILLLSALVMFSPKSYAQNFLFPGCDSTTVDSVVCQEKNKGQTHTGNSLYGPSGALTKAVRIYSIVTGVAAVLVMILAGIKLVMASGDPANVKSAKDTILFAVIGLIVAALGAAIVQFVLIRL